MSKAVEYIRELLKKKQGNLGISTLDHQDFSLELAKFSSEDIVYENDITVLQEEKLVSYDDYLMYGGRVSADLEETPDLDTASPSHCTTQEIQPTPREETIQYEL